MFFLPASITKATGIFHSWKTICVGLSIKGLNNIGKDQKQRGIHHSCKEFYINSCGWYVIGIDRVRSSALHYLFLLPTEVSYNYPCSTNLYLLLFQYILVRWLLVDLGKENEMQCFQGVCLKRRSWKEKVYEQNTSIQYKNIQLLLWFCQGKNCAANEANYNFCPWGFITSIMQCVMKLYHASFSARNKLNVWRKEAN